MKRRILGHYSEARLEHCAEMIFVFMDLAVTLLLSKSQRAGILACFPQAQLSPTI
jgi:hypothetical protein